MNNLETITELENDLRSQQEGEHAAPENVHALNALATTRQWVEARDARLAAESS